MKIDRSKASHWLYLVLFGCNVALAVLLRWLPWRRHAGVVLYGHKFNGNLAAIHAEAGKSASGAHPCRFLTMDPAYHRSLRSNGIPSVLAISPACIPVLAGARAIVADHGLHVLVLLAKLTRVRLFDVWHGIPFKGFDASDFATQRSFDEAWVASPLLEELYVERFGFEPGRVAVTGYARTDRLVRRDEPLEALRERLGLERTRGRKLLLFAPTWKQDAAGRSLVPFGVPAAEFFGALDALCERLGATVLFRAHLNSAGDGIPPGRHVLAVPHADFPDTEAILLLSDVLVCDWSSIAFDYLLLDRPTVFLDVEAPFAKGFSLGPEFRFGAIAGDMAALLQRLEACLADPDSYWREFSGRHAETKARVYGGYADGNSAARCLERLRAFLLKDGFSL